MKTTAEVAQQSEIFTTQSISKDDNLLKENKESSSESFNLEKKI